MIQLAACLIASLVSAQNATDNRSTATLVPLPREAYIEQPPAPRGDDITICVGFEELTAARRARKDRIARLARDLDTGVCAGYGSLNSRPSEAGSTGVQLDFVILMDLFRPRLIYTCGCYDHSAENLAAWADELERILSGGSSPRLWTVIFTEY